MLEAVLLTLRAGRRGAGGYFQQENREQKPKGLPRPSAGPGLWECCEGRFPSNPPPHSAEMPLSPAHPTVLQTGLGATAVPSAWLGHLGLRGSVHYWGMSPFSGFQAWSELTV